MGRLIAQQIVSIDGFAADAAGRLDFAGDAVWEAIDRETLAWLRGVDRILLGSRTYGLFADYWPTAREPLAAPINSIPKTVFSSRRTEAPWGEHAAADVEAGEPVQAVTEMRSSARGDLVLWGSITLFRSLLAAGVIDEVQLRVVPTVLGAGTPLFGAPAPLRLLGATPYDCGIVVLRYAPERPAGEPAPLP